LSKHRTASLLIHTTTTQHNATDCSRLQQTATEHTCCASTARRPFWSTHQQHNRLQQTATLLQHYCNTTATNCSRLQQTAAQLQHNTPVEQAPPQHNRLQQTATDCNKLQQTATEHTCCASTARRPFSSTQPQHNRRQQTATGCNTLQQTAADCNILQQTAT